MAGKWHKFLLSAQGGNPLSASDIAPSASLGTFLKQTAQGLAWETTTVGGETSLSRIGVFGNNRREITIKCTGSYGTLKGSFESRDSNVTGPISGGALSITIPASNCDADDETYYKNKLGHRIVSTYVDSSASSTYFGDGAVIKSVSDYNSTTGITISILHTDVDSNSSPITSNASTVTFEIFSVPFSVENDAVFQEVDSNNSVVDHNCAANTPIVVLGFTEDNSGFNTGSLGSRILFPISDINGNTAFVTRAVKSETNDSLELNNVSNNTQVGDTVNNETGTAIVAENLTEGGYFLEQLKTLSFKTGTDSTDNSNLKALLTTDSTSGGTALDAGSNYSLKLLLPQDIGLSSTVSFSALKLSSSGSLKLSKQTSNTHEITSIYQSEGNTIKLDTGEDGSANPAGKVLVSNDLEVTGDLTIQGTTTTINSTTLQVDDKNIELGTVETPSDTTADGGGVTLIGATEKTILWDNDNDNWTSNQDWNLATGKVFRINDVNTLSATTLGSTVVDSHLRKIGGDNATEETYYGSGTYPTDENGEPIVTLGSHILHIGADYGKSLMSGSIAEKYRKTPKIVFNHVGDNSPATSQIQQKAEIWFDARNDVTGGNSLGDGKGGWINLSLSRRTTSSGSGYAFEDDGFYGSTTKFGMSILAPGENEKALNIYLNNPSTGLEKGYIDFGNVGEGIILLDYNVENAFQIGHNASGSLDSYLTISTDANDEKITLHKDVEVSENLTLAQDKVLKADFIDATEEDDSNKRIEFLDYEGTPVYAFEDARFDLTSPSDSGNDSHDRVLLQTQNLLLNLSASDENENGQGFVIGIGRKAQFSDGQGEMINFTNSGSNFYYKVQNENKLFEVLQSSEGDALGEDASGNAHAQPAKAAFYVPLTLSNQTHDTADTSYTFPSARGSNNQIMVTDSNGILSWADPASEGATYTISCADGDNTDEEKIVLTGSDNSTDEVVLEAGTGLSISRLNDKITFVNTETDTNTWIALTGTVSGYVAAEGSSNTAKFLNGNAEWSIPPNDNDNTTYSTSVVDSSNDVIIRLTGSDTSTDDVKLVAGTDISLTPTNDDIEIAYTGTTPTQSSLGVDDLITLSGVDEGSEHLATFTGSTITDNQTVKQALQLLETAVEGKSDVSVANQSNNELITCTTTGDTLQSETNLKFDGSTNTLEVAGNGVGQLDVDHRKLSKDSAGSVGAGAGDITYYPATTGLTAGKVYYLTGQGGGTWTLTDADSESTSSGLLAVALGSNAGTDGMLLRGIVQIDNTYTINDGAPLFLRTSAGFVDDVKPSGTGDIVRMVGYAIDGSEHQIYFNPDNTYIELT